MSRIDPIKEAQAVTALKETLISLGVELEEGGLAVTEDQKNQHNNNEKKTGFFEAVDTIMGWIAEDQAMVAAVKEQEAALKARRERFVKRVEINKALIEQAFLVADLPKVERPLGTLYLSNRAPKVIIETESDIPPKYWKPADPVLDQKLLADDLKARRAAMEAIPAEPGKARDAAIAAFQADFPDIPGATLSNGSRSLSIGPLDHGRRRQSGPAGRLLRPPARLDPSHGRQRLQPAGVRPILRGRPPGRPRPVPPPD